MRTGLMIEIAFRDALPGHRSPATPKKRTGSAGPNHAPPTPRHTAPSAARKPQPPATHSGQAHRIPQVHPQTTDHPSLGSRSEHHRTPRKPARHRAPTPPGRNDIRAAPLIPHRVHPIPPRRHLRGNPQHPDLSAISPASATSRQMHVHLHPLVQRQTPIKRIRQQSRHVATFPRQHLRSSVLFR